MYVMSAYGGSEPLRLTPAQSYFRRMVAAPPKWSPSGDRLAYAARNETLHPEAGLPGASFVYIVNSDGTGYEKIAETLSPPSWSPDGQRITHVRREGRGMALYTMEADGANPRMVVPISRDEVSWVEQVSWSPGGNLILFTCGSLVCVVDMSGSLVNAPSLSLAGLPVDGPWFVRGVSAAWSPDGSRVAMLVALQGKRGNEGKNVPNGSPALVTESPDGSDRKVLVRSGLGPVPEHSGYSGSGYEDIAAGIAACSAGFVIAEPEKKPGLVKDCRVLLGLRDTLARSFPKGRSRTDTLTAGVIINWGPGVPVDQWEGVVVTGTPPRVTGINLTHIYGGDESHRLTGEIPSQIKELTKLQSLGLSGNQLTGSIPPELGNLEELRSLYLSGNQLTGRVPPELASLVKLESLGVHTNNLEECLPRELVDRADSLRWAPNWEPCDP